MAQHRASGAGQPLLKSTVLWNQKASGVDSVDQESYAAVVASMGFLISKLDVSDFDTTPLDEHALLLIPHASSQVLSSKQVQRTVGMLQNGLRLVTGGRGPLLSALKFRLGEPLPVNVVIDQELPANHLHWADAPPVEWIAELPDSTTRVLYADSATGHPLVATVRFGRGKCLVLGPPLDPVSGRGYSRFPTIVNAISEDLGCRPLFKRQAVDAYFDPGYRYAIPIDSLALFWKTWGIRAVHASAWYYGDTRPYDYKKLIDAAHRRGILVYLWLEWPHVGKGFWDRHPEWRQKNALLQDAKLDWLHLMDLQNPDCMNAALHDLSQQLSLDWDGVDIAEFTITGAGGEALAGPSKPEGFTSFGPDMRREFRAVAGFDPFELVDPGSEHFWKRDSTGLEEFYKYRAVVNNRLLRRVVESLRDLKKKENRDWELIHTIVDNSLHPEFDRLFGFDMNATLNLVKKYGMTLNVEDPYMEWDDPPIRYRRLRETLRALIPGRLSMIDINVVPIHPPALPGFASSQPTGTEFLQQLQYASERHGRVCVYSESTVFDQDWSLIPHTMASGSTAKKNADGWDVAVPATVTFKVAGNGALYNSGKLWPCWGPEGIVLPEGTHHIAFRKTSTVTNPEGPRLVAITGELLECIGGGGSLDITYSSPSRCLVSLNSRPKRILIDGSEARLTVLKSENCSVIIAPSGKHRLAVSGN